MATRVARWLDQRVLAGRATVPGVLYGIGLRMSLRRQMILSKSLRAPARVALRTLFARSLRQNRSSSFCSGRGENLVTIARFGKPLFANMHHHTFIQDCSDRRPRAPCCPEESERGAAHPHRKEPDEQGQGTRT